MIRLNLPLSDLTVVDLSRILSGPFATMALGDFGARIIKVEPPAGDDTRTWGPPFVEEDAAYFLSVNRNKESVVLDLKKPEDLRVLEALIRRADVVVENFRPGTIDRLGIGYDRLRELNPRIILCSISGYGQTGPKRE
ncbi:L-carnitine dehydratase/bile acid-inducible protein F, partial [mine drainage metagenome]